MTDQHPAAPAVARRYITDARESLGTARAALDDALAALDVAAGIPADPIQVHGHLLSAADAVIREAQRVPMPDDPPVLPNRMAPRPERATGE